MAFVFCFYPWPHTRVRQLTICFAQRVCLSMVVFLVNCRFEDSWSSIISSQQSSGRARGAETASRLMEYSWAASAASAGEGEKVSNESQKNSDPVRLCAYGKRAFAPPSHNVNGGVRSSSPPANSKKKRHCAERASGTTEKDNNDDEESDDDDDDIVILEPPPQRSTAEKSERTFCKPDARRILVTAIQARVENSMPTTDTLSSASGNSDNRNCLSWVSRVWGQLGAAGTLETAQLVAAACDGAAEWLRHQWHTTGSTEHQKHAKDTAKPFTQKRKCATTIMDIMALLPRADSNDELVSDNIHYHRCSYLSVSE